MNSISLLQIPHTYSSILITHHSPFTWREKTASHFQVHRHIRLFEADDNLSMCRKCTEKYCKQIKILQKYRITDPGFTLQMLLQGLVIVLLNLMRHPETPRCLFDLCLSHHQEGLCRWWPGMQNSGRFYSLQRGSSTSTRCHRLFPPAAPGHRDATPTTEEEAGQTTAF